MRMSQVLCGIALFATFAAEAAMQKKEVLSPVYTIDRKFKSMEGPQSTQDVFLLETEKPELLWITSFQSEMVGADGESPMLPELMCHVNLDIDMAKHREIFGWTKSVSPRILTLSQGQLLARFPKGYGFPIMSNEPLILTTQVLNHNIEHPDLAVRHRVTFEFVRDAELEEPLKPLFNTGVFGMTLVEGEDGIFGKSADDELHGTSCLLRPQAPNAMGGSLYKDDQGRVFTGHWVVKPGREVNHTNVTRLLSLPFDTTLHYAAVHVHPFAKSLELRDLTTGQSIFISKADSKRRGIGLEKVTSFSSDEGVPLKKDHEYELVSVYDNRTKADVDSMAVMYLSVLDHEFRKPDLASTATPAITSEQPAIPVENKWMIIRTTAGDMGFKLLPDVAPNTVAQFAKLVRSGLFDGVRFARLEPGFVLQAGVAEDRSTPLTDHQRMMIAPMALEAGSIHHARGALSMARRDGEPDSAETSFSIVLGDAPHLDGQYTLFGQLEVGWDVLSALEKAPRKENSTEPAVRIEIVKAEMVDPGKEIKLDFTTVKPIVAESAP